MLIFVIDDHPLMREAIVMMFRRILSDADIVELDRIGAVAAACVKHGDPDLFCLDLKLPDTNGVSGVREVRAQFPKTPIVVLSASPASDYEDLSIEAGADMYLEKAAGAVHMGQALRAMISPDSGLADADIASPEKLSKRQKQLLMLLDQGMSNRDIAAKLEISEHTVKVHLWRLFRRLDVKSRTQATHWARTQGII